MGFIAKTKRKAVKGGVRQAVPHDSARKHVTGAAIYADDMPEPPGLLHCWLRLSEHPHARIKRIDVETARAMPGVVAVVAAADIPGHNDIGPILRGEPCLVEGVAEYVGHPIAAVAAETRAQAREAAARIAIEYEVLAPVLDVETALARQSFVCKPQTIVRGDAETALDRALHRLKGEVRVGGQDHFYLEGQIAVAVPQEDRDMLVYSSTQHPTEVQHGVAHVLGVPFNAVTVEVRRVGGAFGGKESQATIIAAIAALLADKTRRPVKLRLSRDDDMIVTGKRHGFLIRYDVGFDARGAIKGIDMTYAANAGNIADLSSAVLTRALCHADNCYYLPHAVIRGFACKTNTVSNTAFRGFGGPQGMVGIETVIEHIATHLGLSRDAVRRANYYDDGERSVTPYGQPVEDNIAPQLSDRVAEMAAYEARRQAIAEFNRTSPVLRKGIALMPVKFGISFNLPTLNQAGALVHVYTDGSVQLNHGGIEMGQGLMVKVAQVVAECFQIDLDRIKVTAASTAKVPNTSATAASTGSDLNGMAALNAAETIRQRLIDFAAERFQVPRESVIFRDNHVHVGTDAMPFGRLAQLAWQSRISLSATGFYRTPGIHWDQRNMQGRPFFYFAYGAAVAEVAIDTLTGEYRVLRADLLHDCGTSLNPAIDLGQIEGGFVQGMGWLTMEELWWDGRGRLRTHAPSTYKIPGSRDLPSEFRVHILDKAPNRARTVFRSKAVGEPPLMLAISVWLALRDAVAGLADHRLMVRLDAPATPERVLAAVEDIRARLASPDAGEAAPAVVAAPALPMF